MGFVRDYRTRLERALDSVSLCGNGGSAATANHFACDIVKGASYGCERRFKIMSLAEQIPTLTAYSNDVGYDSVFVEPLKNFAERGDVVMAISGSGNSENVIRAVDYAKRIGCFTVGLSGMSGGRLRPSVDLSVHVPHGHMGRVEDAHFVVCHMVCYHFMDTEPGGYGSGGPPIADAPLA